MVAKRTSDDQKAEEYTPLRFNALLSRVLHWSAYSSVRVALNRRAWLDPQRACPSSGVALSASLLRLLEMIRELVISCQHVSASIGDSNAIRQIIFRTAID